MFGLRHAVGVECSAPQDEAVVVKPEFGRVEENDLAQMRLHRFAALANRDSQFLRHAPRDLPELVELLGLAEPFRAQQQFVLAVLNDVVMESRRGADLGIGDRRAHAAFIALFDLHLPDRSHARDGWHYP